MLNLFLHCLFCFVVVFFLNIGLVNNRLLCCTLNFGFTEISSDFTNTILLTFLLWSLHRGLVLLESLFAAAA